MAKPVQKKEVFPRVFPPARSRVNVVNLERFPIEQPCIAYGADPMLLFEQRGSARVQRCTAARPHLLTPQVVGLGGRQKGVEVLAEGVILNRGVSQLDEGDGSVEGRACVEDPGVSFDPFEVFPPQDAGRHLGVLYGTTTK